MFCTANIAVKKQLKSVRTARIKVRAPQFVNVPYIGDLFRTNSFNVTLSIQFCYNKNPY